MGTVDGPGVRAVVFAQGCPLRCDYCHNPDTWDKASGSLTDSQELAYKIIRYYPYIKNGGVTFSGGEPLLQAEFFIEVAKKLKEKGLHIALDTCGHADNPFVDELLRICDLILLDIKFTNEEDYKKFTGGSLNRTLEFLRKLERLKKDVWIREVVIPEINDSEENIVKLSEILKEFSIIKKVELLPFKKLCLEKYEMLGLTFPLKNTPEMNTQKLSELQEKLESLI